jgi:hypothetical protein
VTHPQYSPDFAPLDFHLCPKLKKHLTGHHNASDDEVKMAVKLWFRHQDAQFSPDRLTELRERWRKCVDREGDYVEKQLYRGGQQS